MPLSQAELEALIRLIGLTRESEIDCDQCLDLIAEFAEQQLAGRSLAEGLEAVEHHLRICPECQTEYEVLRGILENRVQEESDEPPAEGP